MKNKVLFISDIDGTLLHDGKILTEFTKNQINRFHEKGINFSVATARSVDSVCELFKDVNISVPLVLMNGVMIYDNLNNKFLKNEYIDSINVNKIIKLYKDNNLCPFMYTFKNNRLLRYFEKIDGPITGFYYERKDTLKNGFMKTENFYNEANSSEILYFTVLDEYDKLYSVYNTLKTYENIEVAFYKDVYLKKYWFLEVFNSKGTKFNGVKYLKSLYKYDYVIGFGDNLNDIPLAKACDEFYAVENGVDFVKNIAKGITLSNNKDGVVKFINHLLYNFSH